MIKSIIFDFDEMLLIEKGHFSDYIIKKHNLSEELRNFFTNEFPLCRLGVLDTKEALSEYLIHSGYLKGSDEFIEEWRNFGIIDEDFFPIIEALKKKGIICILATNNEQYRMNHFIRKYKLEECFNKIFLSYQIGYLKPQREFFNKMLEDLKIPKENILFCDDKPHFIDAAKEFGFKTHLYTDKERFRELLKQESLL